mgnify:CR=1 FL=1
MTGTTKKSAARKSAPKTGTTRKSAAKKKSAAKTGTTALAKIIKYAKAYQKEHPKSKWVACVKHGGAEYRKKHK